MPELPEVETIARQLDRVLVGQILGKVTVLREKSFWGRPKQVEGRKVTRVWRRAKMAVIDLAGEMHLLVHLKMTGQLIYQRKSKSGKVKTNLHFKDHRPHFNFEGRIVGGHPTPDWVKELPSAHTRVIFELSKGRLFFNDQRVFGWIKVITNDELRIMNQDLPPDVIDRNFTVKYLSHELARTRRAVKIAITDQAKMGGVGNIYANDALWLAGVDPRRAANSLNEKERVDLFRAIQKVIRQGIRYGGATASDDKFVHVTGLGGKYQEHFLVYDRAGERCRRCRGTIKRMSLGGRGTFYCAECQR